MAPCTWLTTSPKPEPSTMPTRGRRGHRDFKYFAAFKASGSPGNVFIWNALLGGCFCLLPSAFCLLPSAFCLLPSAFSGQQQSRHGSGKIIGQRSAQQCSESETRQILLARRGKRSYAANLNSDGRKVGETAEGVGGDGKRPFGNLALHGAQQ